MANTFRLLFRTQVSRACSIRPFHASSLNTASLQKSRIATKRTPPARSSPPRRSETWNQRSSSAAYENLDNEAVKKRAYATHLYNKGRTIIYRAPSHAGMLGASYIIAGSCFLTALGLGSTHHWAYDPESSLQYPGFVRWAWRLGILTFGVIGVIALLRPLRTVRSIDLVSQDGVVKLLVKVRHPIPFLQPWQHIIHPYDLKTKETFVQQIEEPQWAQSSKQPTNFASSIAQSISKAIFYPFASVRKLMTLEGIMYVTLVDGGNQHSLDTAGLWSDSGKDFVEMTTREF